MAVVGTPGMKQVTLRHPQVRPTRAGLHARRWVGVALACRGAARPPRQAGRTQGQVERFGGGPGPPGERKPQGEGLGAAKVIGGHGWVGSRAQSPQTGQEGEGTAVAPKPCLECSACSTAGLIPSLFLLPEHPRHETNK